MIGGEKSEKLGYSLIKMLIFTKNLHEDPEYSGFSP